MAYDANNIFARILRGEAPAHVVHDDAQCMAFMDVMPQATGHTLVIPRAPATDILSVDADALAATIRLTQRVAIAVKRVFDAPGVLVAQLSGAAAGQSVFHLHFHVIPRHNGLDLRFHARDMANPAELAEQARRIRAALADIAPGPAR